MKRVIFSIAIALIFIPACKGCGGNNITGTDEPEFDIEGTGIIQIEMPQDEQRTIAQPQSLILRNTGDGVLEITRFEWVARPDRLVAVGEASGECGDGGACGQGEICLTQSGTCRKTGLPSTPLELESQLRDDIDFAIEKGPLELECPEAPGEVPATVGSRYCGEIVLETNAINDGDVVTGGAARIFFLSPGASGKIEAFPQFIEFTGVQPGTTHTRDFSVQNVGVGPLTIDDVEMASHNDIFTITTVEDVSYPFDVEPGDSSEWVITLEAPADATESDLEINTEVAIESSAANPLSDKIAVEVSTGAGSAPFIEFDTELLRFDAQDQQTLTISNTGEATLRVTGLDVRPIEADPFYTFDFDGTPAPEAFPVTIPTGESEAMTVTFARPMNNMDPSVGVLEIAHNDRNKGNSSELTLLGDEGDVPIGQIRPESFQFLAADGNSEGRIFTIRNIGTADLTIDDLGWMQNVGEEAEFQISGHLVTIPAGEIATATVDFTGTNAQVDVLRAIFGSNNGGAPLELSLRATDSTAMAPTATVTKTFANDARVGQPATFSASDSMPAAAVSNATWTLLERPSGSAVWFHEVGEELTFVPDVAGTYRLSLLLPNQGREAQTEHSFDVVE